MFDHPLEAWFYSGRLTCCSSHTAAISGVEHATYFFTFAQQLMKFGGCKWFQLQASARCYHPTAGTAEWLMKQPLPSHSFTASLVK